MHTAGPERRASKHTNGTSNAGDCSAADLMAPRTVSLPLSLSVRVSVGSPSFLMSHHSTLPSVDTDMHSVPVLDCSQAKSYTGSLQTNSACYCSFLVVFYSILQSTDTDMHSVLVLDCSQAKSYTWSLQEDSVFGTTECQVGHISSDRVSNGLDDGRHLLSGISSAVPGL